MFLKPARTPGAPKIGRKWGPRAPGASQTSKTHPTNPARLPSGTQTAFNCGSGPENGHGTALELVSGANFGYVLHNFRARPVGTGLGAKFGRKPAKTQNKNYNCYNLF